MELDDLGVGFFERGKQVVQLPLDGQARQERAVGGFPERTPGRLTERLLPRSVVWLGR